MEGDGEPRQGSSALDPTLKGPPGSSSLSSADQLRDDASLNIAACGVRPSEPSSAFPGPRLTVEVGEVINGEPPRTTDQQTAAPAVQENSSRSRAPIQGFWVSDEDHDEDSDDSYDDMRLDIDGMSYEQLLELGEHIGYVSTGVKEEVIKTKLKRGRRSPSMMGSPFDGETCCICQEEYEDDEDVGKLDCGHEYHMTCIKEWLSKKNSCPICKKTAFAA